MNLIEEIVKLDNLLSYERVSGSSGMETEIIPLIRSVTAEVLSGYDVQKEYIANLLAVYERHDTKSVSYLINLISYFNRQLDTFPVSTTTTSSIEDPEDIPEALVIMEKVYKELKKIPLGGIRLSSDFELPLDHREKEMFIGITNYMLNGLAKREQIEQSDLTTALQNLSIVRNLTKSLGNIELFYLLLRSLFDILQRHEKYQLARDVAEDCLACGYKDGMEDVAYSQVLRVYASTASVPAALHYCFSALTFQATKKRIIDFAYKGIVTGLMKLFRNAHQYELARTFYEQRSERVPFHDYEQRSLHHTYLSTFLAVRDVRAPQMIADYLDQQREAVIAAGEVEALPWLTLLYNITAIYGEVYTGADQCQMYRRLFEQIVPAIRRRKIEQVILPTSLAELSVHLTTALTNLAATRNETDFTTDNTWARLISNRLIRMSFDLQDWRSYLLAMIINSDYSITFKQRLVPEVIEVKDNQRPFSEIYHTSDEIADLLQSLSDSSIVWLGSDDRQVYPLVYTNEAFAFCKNSTFSIAQFQQWIERNFANLPLEDTKISIAGMKMPKTSDDYLLEEKELAGNLNFTALDTSPAENVLIVKDYEISSFPHNLLLCRDRGFVLNSSPVMNIMSAEWLLEKIRDPHQPETNFSKGIWIPTETGDYVLNYLFSFIEKTLSYNGFSIDRDPLPARPLRYDLNIVAAHGKPQISSFPALFAYGENETFSIVRLSHVIGIGKILVLFVCHSGSMQSDLLRNRISSMIRGYLKAGYEAVIAPFWALDISIARDWLPAFMDSLTAGNPVIKAVHDGNMRVRESYPTPRAYACLHAYGNPYFRLAPSPNH